MPKELKSHDTIESPEPSPRRQRIAVHDFRENKMNCECGETVRFQIPEQKRSAPILITSTSNDRYKHVLIPLTA